MGVNRKIVLKEDIVKALKEVGIKEGDHIMVHTSLSKIGFVFLLQH